MLKVLIISYEFPPDIGGAGVVADEYAAFFTQNSIDATVLTKRNNKRDKKHELFRIVEFPYLPKIQPFFMFLWLKIMELSGSKFDNIILNDSGANLMASLFFSKKMKSRSIVFLHGSEDHYMVNNPSRLYKYLGIKNKYHNLLRDARRCISISSFLKQKFILKTGFIDINDKITIIRNSVNEEKLIGINKEKDPFEQYKLDGYNILFSASRIVKKKGYENMFLIFNEIIENGGKFKWVIGGEGDFKEELINLVKSHNLEKDVIFLGGIERDRIFHYYYYSDLFWLLSEFEEGLGLVYLESALCGTKVIGNNLGGVKEVVNNDTGWLTNSVDEIKRILLNQQNFKYCKELVIQSAQELNANNKHLIFEYLI